MLTTIKRLGRADQRRLHWCGRTNQDCDRVVARIVGERDFFPVVGEPHVARRIDRDPRVPSQGVARIASTVWGDRLADPTFAGGALGRVKPAEVADPVQWRPGTALQERKARVRDPDVPTTIRSNPHWTAEDGATPCRLGWNDFD